MSTLLRRAAWWLSLALLVVTGVLGLSNGVSEWSGAHGALQQSVTIGVLVYGVLGLATAVALVRGWRQAAVLAVLWAVVITYVSGVAAIAYGGDEPSIVGAVMGGIGAAAIGIGVAWTIRGATLRARAASEETRRKAL